MIDYQHVVDSIRGFLASTNQTRTDELQTLAQRYAALCREANERLRKCGENLNKALWSDAIHMADQPPNLLDLVAALDFSELDDWRYICFQYELRA